MVANQKTDGARSLQDNFGDAQQRLKTKGAIVEEVTQEDHFGVAGRISVNKRHCRFEGQPIPVEVADEPEMFEIAFLVDADCKVSAIRKQEWWRSRLPEKFLNSLHDRRQSPPYGGRFDAA